MYIIKKTKTRRFERRDYAFPTLLKCCISSRQTSMSSRRRQSLVNSLGGVHRRDEMFKPTLHSLCRDRVSSRGRSPKLTLSFCINHSLDATLVRSFPGGLKPFIPTWSYCRVLDRLFLVRLVLRLFVSTRRSKTRGGRGMTHVFNLTRQGPVPFHPFFFFCCNASPLEPVAVSSGALPTACNVALLSP